MQVRIRSSDLPKTAEFGFKVYLDQGEDPAADLWDHFRWWGPNPQNKNRVLTIDGYYKNPTQSHAMTFAGSHDAPATHQSGTRRRAKRTSTAEHKARGGKEVVQDGHENPQPPKSVGWIVIKVHKVTGYRKAKSGEEPRPKRTRFNDDTKPFLLSEASKEVIDDSGAVAHEREPIFEDAVYFEMRIRYGTFDMIRREVRKMLPDHELQPAFFRGIPLESLVHDKQLRRYCLGRMLKCAQSAYAVKAQLPESERADNHEVALVDLLKQIQMHFDDHGADILCAEETELTPMSDRAMQASRCPAQGKPSYVENVALDDGQFHPDAQMLQSLRKEIENESTEFDIGVRDIAGSSDQVPAPVEHRVTVKFATINLDSDGDDV